MSVSYLHTLRTKIKMSLLSGKVICADCKSKLHYCTINGFEARQDFFTCANYRSNMGSCSAHYIRNVTLCNMVFKYIKKMLVYVQQFEETFVRDQMERLDNAMAMSISKAKVDVVTLRRRDEDLNTLFKRLYEDMVSGRITAERFDMLASEYEQEQKELKAKIEIYYNAVGIIDLPTIKEDDCIALHGRCKGKKIAV
ncbi:MAG: hypothetical protein E7633_08035 [Ruminococcaceae bacterium]|nr:hypothetical protein [Oscillospiraceae bacterium]